MRLQAFTGSAVVPATLLAFLAGCGGGYQAPMSMVAGMPMTPPMPTVKFSSPAQAVAINLGQAVPLSWSATNATSCSASSTGTIGGAFSGAQPASGTIAVAPTGVGTATYTLSCTGSGGMATATTATVTVNPSTLSTLNASSITTVGLTLRTTPNAGNPYGLVIAPATNGLVTQGDLVICNFNDPTLGTQGSGTTIVGLHPSAASAQQLPYTIAQDPALTGCDALAMLPDDSIAAAAFNGSPGSNGQDLLVTANGVVTNPFGLAGDVFVGPWGQTFVPATSQNPAALYVSSYDGSIDRITLNGDAQMQFMKIATGFCGSGKPGAIFAPAGLTYDASIDTLYVVDTSSNSVVAFANVSGMTEGAVIVNGQCTSGTPPAPVAPPTAQPTFTGPSSSSVRVIAHGSPFNAPISAALLADGDLLVANGDLLNTATIPTAMQNLLLEISPVLPGGFVGQPLQLDATGTAAALFGLVATVDAQGNPVVYFNDDNSNAVMRLSR